jgi:DNA-binding response OmpR family regulator
MQAGARDFIVKPFKPDAVIATIQKVLEKPE